MYGADMLDRQTTLNLARLLNEVVVSGDRIGSALHDDEEQAAREWYAYCQEIDFWRRAAKLRRSALDALWPDPTPEDDDQAETELAGRYWRNP